MTMNIIKIENLSKYFKVLKRSEGFIGAFKDLFSRDYKIIKAVDNISFKVQEGEIIGFLGPNGAGKSTTIKMMSGVLEPTSGSIFINGYIPYKSRKKYVKNIGVVFGQRTQLWWEIPVIESFKILKEIYKIEPHIYNENMKLFNELFDLKALYPIPVRKLSLGQRMLCDIIASFLHNPKIIFFDEPTIGLDVSVKNKIQTLIKDLNKVKKTTIILTSHDIGSIEALCRRLILIDKGSVIYDGGILKFNRIFGAYRILKVELDHLEDSSIEVLSKTIRERFPCKHPIPVRKDDDGWISLTINQDEVKLRDVLNYIMKEYPIKDLKIEEIETEDVVRKVYEGELV